MGSGMMERFWRATGVALGKHWKIVTVVVLLITAVMAIGTSKIEFATGQDSYLNPDSQVALDNVEFQGNFGGETVIMLLTAEEGSGNTVSDLFAGENLETFERINRELGEIDGDRDEISVITPYTSLTFSDALVKGAGRDALLAAAGRDPDPAGIEARNADVTISLARLGAIPEDSQAIGEEAWNDLLIFGNDGFTVGGDSLPVPPPVDERAIRLSLASTFPNQQTAVGGVVLKGNASLDQQSESTQQVLDILETAQFEGFDLTVTGSPVYLKEINDYLKGGMLTLGLAAIVVMALVLALMFGVRWRLLPLLAVLFGVAWSFSLLGLIGIDLSLVTIAGMPILIGLGIDFAIQVHNRVEEEVVLDNEEHPIGETLANLAPPLIAAMITGVVAFLALQISKVPMIRDFGILLAIGVAVLVAVGIVIPATALGIREFKKPTKQRARSRVERIVVWLGSLATKWGPALVAAAVVLFVGGILVEGRTKIQSDPVEWIDQGSDTVADIHRLEDRTGFSTTLGVLFEASNVYDQRVIDLIHQFTTEAEARPQVASSSSLVNTMAKIIRIEGASDLAPTTDDVVEAGLLMPEDIARALVAEDGTAAQVNLRLAPASLDDRAVLVDELRADLDRLIAELDLPTDSVLFSGLPLDQEPVRAVPAGLATVGIGLLENLEANRAALTYLALCLAALYLTARHRSLTRGLLALVPVFLAVGVSSLVVGLAGLELSPLTTVGGPLVIATCAEFSVLILGRYLEERQTGLPPREAVDMAASRTGRAFFTSACTTIGGFAVLISSALPLLRDFGIIVTMNVAVAVLAALVVMPPLMVWVDERGWLGTAEQRHSGSVRLAAVLPGSQTPLAVAGVVAFAAGGVGVYAAADTSSGVASEIAYAAVALPTTTTTSTTTTTTTTTTLAPGVEPPPSTEPAGPEVDPSGFPTEPPATPIAAILFQRLIDQGVEPNVANCGITTAYEEVDEAGLIAMGIATLEPEPVAVVTRGALKCGIPQETIDAAIEEQRSGG